MIKGLPLRTIEVISLVAASTTKCEHQCLRLGAGTDVGLEFSLEVELLDPMVESFLLMDAVHGRCLDLSLLVATPLACQHKQRDFPCLTPDISACRIWAISPIKSVHEEANNEAAKQQKRND